MLLKDISVLGAFGAVLSALILYLCARVVYDLFLSPLSAFPGPKIAAIGSLYEFYYDVVRDGTYLWEIERMHQQYGPIVRINSRSLHVHDPEFFSDVYAGSGRRINKEPSAVAGYTFPHSSIATIDHDLHRKRRAIVSPYFSKRAIVNLEPVIRERLDALCRRLGEQIAPGAVVDLTSAFSAFTADVVTYHFYGGHRDYLGSAGFSFGLKDALTALLDYYHLTRFLPVSPTTIKSLPLPILRLLSPHFPLVVSARDSNKELIKKVLSDRDSKEKSKSVIVSALTDPSVPAAEKSIDRLADEGETIIFAGIDTTARTLGVAMFHLMHNRDVLSKLRQNLDAAAKPSGEALTTAELEAIPYMRGVVQESIRLAYGLVVRIPRIATEEALQYGEYTIPPGTPVSQSTYLVNNDPTIFTNPSTFDPDRWVEAAKEGINLDKYMVSFSKGSRACLGINLAYSMLFLGIAKVASSIDMELFDTKPEDIQVYHTRGFAFPKEGSGSVKAKMTGRRQ